MRSVPACDLPWIERAPALVQLTTHLAAPPERVFAAFADAAGWTRWFPTMTEAAWLDDSGGGLGKEREVALRGLGRFRERFIAWEAPHRFAFTIIATTSPMIAQLGEDYRLTADGSGTRFDWTMGSQPRGLGKLATPLLRPMLRRIVRRAVANLDRELAAK
jgi:uncharacterized protein YndB with AHSA1/START domain